jgi:hypothetical protein
LGGYDPAVITVGLDCTTGFMPLRSQVDGSYITSVMKEIRNGEYTDVRSGKHVKFNARQTA